MSDNLRSSSSDAIIDAATLTDETLISYHLMMGEIVLVKNFSSLAVAVWSDVLRELDKRGKIRLISGNYSDPCDALLTLSSN
ncbi:hypothetical protein [Falsirhodobacter sp. alg1]|uniref:hypothetical protein n=1 Tax=Falsirhodobacter sp. alg1 TaxID=1472418 RepID=UPI0005EE2C2C|nr:hypothetical protein [Falsirhodobacter sp. alg1]